MQEVWFKTMLLVTYRIPIKPWGWKRQTPVVDDTGSIVWSLFQQQRSSVTAFKVPFTLSCVELMALRAVLKHLLPTNSNSSILPTVLEIC